MPGGEYLSASALQNVWRALALWVAGKFDSGGVSAFLARHAPAWRRVGRLTFHLAENRAGGRRPFAFMATYVPSLTLEGLERHAPLMDALKHYEAEGDKAGLIRLLSPVRAAAEKLPWVAEMHRKGELYRPQLWTAAKAYRLLSDLPILEESGLSARVPDWWRERPRARVRVVVGANKTPSAGLKSILDWNMEMAAGDETVDPLELMSLLEESGASKGLVMFKGRWIEADRAELSKALEYWDKAKIEAKKSGVSFLRALRLIAGVPDSSPLKSGSPSLGKETPVEFEAGEALKKILSRLKDPGESPEPEGLKAVLRPYQKEGLSWLAFLSSLGLGACLADDMGLGKTVQVLALLLLDKNQRGGELEVEGEKESGEAPEAPPRTSLLAAPASLLANWRAEADRFAPSLRLSVFHPSETPKERIKLWEEDPERLSRESDLVVTSYSTLSRSLDFFKKMAFRFVILDEAQAVKNPGANQSRAVKALNAESRVALTGTPVENRLTDLWSIFDFLNPGLLGSLKGFQDAVREMETVEKSYAPLRRLVSPYILRRLKSDKKIIDDLPDKVETVLYCRLTKEQMALYMSVVDSLAASLGDLKKKPERERDGKRRGLVLQSLMRLKQLINHPAQLTGDMDWRAEKSGKFLRLAELCGELAQRQERVLVFTQYREIIDPLSRHLETVFGRPGISLHGGTPVKARRGLVEEFQSPGGPPFFILSLKAGGTGLNLTRAGQVIHFDRWWNPAVEDQATDRAYRIGQKKNVLVHKCVTPGTVEQRVDELLSDKRTLAREILETGAEINLLNMEDADLLKLVSLDASRAAIS
jgi:non-specific serine/threonine protein kinase